MGTIPAIAIGAWWVSGLCIASDDGVTRVGAGRCIAGDGGGDGPGLGPRMHPTGRLHYRDCIAGIVSDGANVLMYPVGWGIGHVKGGVSSMVYAQLSTPVSTG